MQTMLCLECRAESHPRQKHRSSFRTETSLWAAAIVAGMLVGTWNAITSPTETDDAASPTTLSAVTAASEAPVDPQASASNTGGSRAVALQIGAWIRAKSLAFLRTAWWLLPVPILFSLWRQFRTVPVCAHCGSRDLAPAG